MTHARADNSSETNRLLERAAAGHSDDWGALLEHHRKRLRCMVSLRLDRRLYGRVDPSEVVREACQEAAARQDEYLHNPAVPFFVWLRLLAGQKLQALHRLHLGAHFQEAGGEIALHRGSLPETTSAALAGLLLGHASQPSEAAARAGKALRLQDALNGMDGLEREVLALRHFEHLTNAEAASVLGVSDAEASQRYIRALRRLKGILTSTPDSTGKVRP
jgi:RNA polymerase sigma-70 factor (ECF subfamily)